MLQVLISTTLLRKVMDIRHAYQSQYAGVAHRFSYRAHQLVHRALVVFASQHSPRHQEVFSCEQGLVAMSSRWATNPDDDAQAAAERKKRKEEKRRQKEERRPQPVIHTTAIEDDNASEEQVTERPTKRQRTTSPSQDTTEAIHLLEFPTSTLSKCGTLERYEILNNIEEGSYGYVSRARSKASGDIVALKRLKIEHNTDGFPVTGLREIETLRACSHAHIVRLREVITSTNPLQE